MNQELQKYYEARFSMMASQGWTDLIEDVERMLQAADTLNGVDSSEKLYFRKGEVSIMNWLLTLKEVSEKAYEELQNEAPV